MNSQTPPTDEQVANALDALAREASRLRRLIPQMRLSQLDSIAGSSPFPSSAADTLLDLDTWAVVAATTLRELTGADVVDLAG